MRGMIRFFKGWVRFRITGGFPERFINLCAMRGLPLWDGVRRGECCEFSAQCRHYRRLRPCARGAGVRLRVLERHGLPFWLKKRRRRWGLAVGVVLCVGALAFSSLFLWNVRVVGNSRLETDQILQTLEKLGVKPGVRCSQIDVRSVERRMMMELSDLGWVAVNLQGSTAVVQVQERVLPPEIVDKPTPCNVVAARGGQIVKMQVYLGQSMVAVGDAVAQGDILVSGVVEDASHDMHLVAARADITARTNHTLQVEIPLEQTQTRMTKVLRRYSLKLGGIEIPLWVGKPPQGRFRLERMYRPITIMGLETPLSVGKRQYLLLEEETVTLSQKQAAARARQQLKALEQENLGGAVVLEKQEDISAEEGVYRLRANYLAEELISVQSEIFVKEGAE
ncbi:MAG: sporulation protein YqfD [Oscillospiraceae bacterium]|nr:sporulation protein YqfD [Oscillospiraceae bacterium]